MTATSAVIVDFVAGTAGNTTFTNIERVVTGDFNDQLTGNIGDWTSGSNKIALDNAVMSALGADGAFVASDARFWASSAGTAHDVNDRAVYNTSTGGLYYDADGSGAGAAQLIATLSGSPAVAATDVMVI